MTKQKRSYQMFMATATAAALVTTAIVPVAYANVSFSNTHFMDVTGHYKVPVDYLYTNGMINGLSATHFGTSQNIQRVDVAVMIANALFTEAELNNAKNSGFIDVPARAVKHINALKERGFINGKTNKNFGSTSFITRGEVALMLAKAYGIEGSVESVTFYDVAQHYEKAVAALVDNGITKGKNRDTFGTVNTITRGELAIFLYRLETLGNVEEDPPQNLPLVLGKLVTFPNNIKDKTEINNIINRLSNIPYRILDRLVDMHVEVRLIDRRLTDEPEYNYLTGVVPRGWEGTGKTWDDVPGVGGSSLVIVKIGHSNNGMGHSSINLELHEVAHTINYAILNSASESKEFIAIHKSEKNNLSSSPYYNYPEEYFAESFAYFFLNEESRAILKEKAPKTYHYLLRINESYQ